VALSEFTGGIEEPETDVTFDVFEVVGGFMGGMMGGLGGDPFADDGMDGPPDDAFEDDFDDEFADEDFAEEDFGEEFCLTEEDIEQMRDAMSEDQREMFEEELERGAVPVC
jgi:hypothetical protein